jgi:DNA-binding IclR family transcriptional regulator
MTDNDDSPTSRERWPIRVRRPNERRSASRSATRALDVLELFGHSRRPLRAIEITRALELPASTTNQLLKTMVESAHLTFDAATKAYFPSLRLITFGGLMIESYGADSHLRELVRELHAALGEIVTLSTPNDIFMQILDRAGSRSDPAEAEAERGLRVSMFGTAIGAAHLSTLARPEIMRLIERARLKPAEIPETLQEIAEVRRRGMAEGPVMNGAVWSLATPLDPGGYPAPLVLGVAGPPDRIKAKLDQVRAAMMDAAQRQKARAAGSAEA